MASIIPTVDDLCARVLGAPRQGRRRLVALAGAPASGKSTLAQQLAAGLCSMGCQTSVVPMDGFHLHNKTLVERGLLDRKGAPHTFDLAGFSNLIARLCREEDVFYPEFDRENDIAIAGSGHVDASCDTLIIEGNYLLFDAPGWRDLRAHWDLALHLEVPLDILEKRLITRWVDHGLPLQQAKTRALQNDIPNAGLVMQAQLPADVTIRFDLP